MPRLPEPPLSFRQLVDEMRPLVIAERAEQGLAAAPSEAMKRRVARHFEEVPSVDVELTA